MGRIFVIVVLPDSFYRREDVLTIAKELLGKVLVTRIDGEVTSGIIVETEAYAGVVDKASHAAGGRRTARTEVMYAPGGVSYVYLCYGIHHLFNVVTNIADIPHAVLIRGLEPLQGIDLMLARRGKKKLDRTLTAGPGALSQALGITRDFTGLPLANSMITIEDNGIVVKPTEIVAAKRVGVDYAGEDALLPYRFYLKGNMYVSKPAAL